MVRAPSPGKSRALQARLRPTMRPFPSPKLGRVPLSSEGASRKGVALRLPSPMSHPARSRVGHLLVPCMIVLFCSFFFFFFRKLCPRPRGPALTRRCDLPVGQRAPRSARRLCIRSARGRSELRAPGSPAGTAEMWRGLRSLVRPLCVPDRCLCPLKAPGQGAWGNAGRSGSHGGTRDLGIRDRESDPEPAAKREGSRRREGGGLQGAGNQFPAPPPGCSRGHRPPTAASIVCGPALPGVTAPPSRRLQIPCGPPRSYDSAAGLRPRPQT